MKEQKQWHMHQTRAPVSSLQASTSPDLQLHLSVVAGGIANLEQKVQSNQICANAAATKLEIQMQSEQMYAAVASSTSSTNADDVTTCTTNYIGTAVPPPTKLHASVTSALWALVSTPSRLFAGLSKLFSDSTSASLGEENDGILPEMGESLNTIGCHEVRTGGIPSIGIKKSNNHNGNTEDVGFDPLSPCIHQLPLENRNSVSLIPLPPLGTAQFGGYKSNYEEAFNNISEVVDIDPRFGRRASGSLFDDVDD